MTKRRQNIIILIESQSEEWTFPSKIGYSYMNRFAIDEDAAFELIGVVHLPKFFFEDLLTKNLYEIQEEDDAAVENLHCEEDAATHLIVAQNFLPESFIPPFRKHFETQMTDAIKKNSTKNILLTRLEMHQQYLITKEKMEFYSTKGFLSVFGHSNQSVFDDLEFLFENLKLDLEETCLKNMYLNMSGVPSNFFPKLTEAELKLVEMKDDGYLNTFQNFEPDVNEEEMKLSESRSKYVKGFARRYTTIIKV